VVTARSVDTLEVEGGISPYVGDLARLDMLERRPLTIGAGNAARLVDASVRSCGDELPTGETHHQVHQTVTAVAGPSVEDSTSHITLLLATEKNRLGIEARVTASI
jgi:hypothetical protein